MSKLFCKIIYIPIHHKAVLRVSGLSMQRIFHPKIDIEISPTRKKLMHLISQKPGICITKMRVLLNLGNGTVYHHLNILEKEKLVISLKIGREKKYWVVKDRPILKNNLFSETCQHIFSIISHFPKGITVGEIIKIVKISYPLCCYHLNTLHYFGLINRYKKGRYTVCIPTEKGM